MGETTAGFEVLSGGKRELSDLDMSLVNAAGQIDAAQGKCTIDEEEDNL